MKKSRTRVVLEVEGKSIDASVTIEFKNGSFVAWDSDFIGFGDSKLEAILEYLSDACGVVGDIEHETRRKMICAGGRMLVRGQEI